MPSWVPAVALCYCWLVPAADAYKPGQNEMKKICDTEKVNKTSFVFVTLATRFVFVTLVFAGKEAQVRLCDTGHRVRLCDTGVRR